TLSPSRILHAAVELAQNYRLRLERMSKQGEPQHVSEIFDASEWVLAPGADGYTDITAHLSVDGRIARIAFDRPEVRNAFRPHTVDELYDALERVRVNPRV